MLDDLSAPLGLDIKKQAARLPAFLPKVIAGVLGSFLLVFVAWAMLADAPFGGEPMAAAPAELHADTAADNKSAPDNHTPPVAGATRPNRYDGPATESGTADATAPASPPHTITMIDGTSGKREQIVIPDQPADQGVDTRLAEPTRNGPIPGSPRMAPVRPKPSRNPPRRFPASPTRRRSPLWWVASASAPPPPARR